MEKIEEFCENPTGSSFKEISKNNKKTFYEIAEFCVKNDLGDIELAEKIITYFRFGSLSEDNQRSVRALYLGLKFITEPEFIKNQNTNYPKLSVYIKGAKTPIFVISGNTELEDMFMIIQKNKVFGVDKELILYPKETKSHLLEKIYDHNLSIFQMKIETKINKANKITLFYNVNIGITWGKMECLNCSLYLNKYQINCNELEDNLEEKRNLKKLYIKYHPDKGGNSTIFQKLKKCGDICSEGCFSSIRHSPPNIENKEIQKLNQCKL